MAVYLSTDLDSTRSGSHSLRPMDLSSPPYEIACNKYNEIKTRYWVPQRLSRTWKKHRATALVPALFPHSTATLFNKTDDFKANEFLLLAALGITPFFVPA